jgi:hypothetical protein
MKTTKFLLIVLAALALVFAWLWADGLKDKKSLNSDIESLNIQIEDIMLDNAELLADAQKETARANKAESKWKDALGVIEKLKKQAPKPRKIPKICLPDATTQGVKDIESVIALLCKEIGHSNRRADFYVNLSLEYEKTIEHGTETIKNLKSANNNYVQAIENFRNLEELQQKKFDMLLKKEVKKKYRWGFYGVLLGTAIGCFGLK